MRRCYCRKANIEYVEVTKAACSSIKAALLATDGQPYEASGLPHMSKHWLDAPSQRPTLLFTFIRDPVDRLLSSFRHKLQTGDAARLARNTISKDSTPDEWAEWVMSQGIKTLDKHWGLQTSALNRYKRQVGSGRPIRLYKFENLRHTWDMLSSTYDLETLTHRNATSGPEKFSPSVVTRLREYYELDDILYNSFNFSTEV